MQTLFENIRRREEKKGNKKTLVFLGRFVQLRFDN